MCCSVPATASLHSLVVPVCNVLQCPRNCVAALTGGPRVQCAAVSPQLRRCTHWWSPCAMCCSVPATASLHSLVVPVPQLPVLGPAEGVHLARVRDHGAVPPAALRLNHAQAVQPVHTCRQVPARHGRGPYGRTRSLEARLSGAARRRQAGVRWRMRCRCRGPATTLPNAVESRWAQGAQG